MPQVFQTTKVHGHDHVLYVLDDGSGQSSVDGKKPHDHAVIFVPPTPVLDEMGQPTQEMGEPKLLLSEAGDGHTHDVIPLEADNKKPKREDKAKIVSRVLGLYREAKKIEAGAREKAKESECFYRGDQWEKDILDSLSDSDRAALVLNYLESTVDFLVGVFRQNRSDWRWSPTEEGDSRVADILNVVTKNIANRTRLPDAENRIFEDICVAGRGFFHVYVDRDENIRGKIRVAHFPWDDVYCGPHDSLIGEDMEYLTKKRWYSLADAKNKWPEKAKDLEEMSEGIDDPAWLKENPDHYGADVGHEDGLQTGAAFTRFAADPDLLDMAHKRVAVLEQWLKEYHTSYLLVDPEFGPEGWIFNAENIPSRIISKFRTISALKVVDRTRMRFRVTGVAGDVILSDDYSDAPFNNFDLVPVYAKKKGCDFWGKVEAGKDPQRQINKTASKFSDVFNKVDNYGYWFDEDTFDTEADEMRALNGVAAPGFFLKCRNADRPPRKEEGIKFPAEIANLWTMMVQNFSRVLNVDPMAMGQTLGSRESGLAVQQKARQTLTGNEFLYDNFSLSKAQVGRYVVALLQQEYTPERIMRIIENQARKEPVTVGGQQLSVPGAARPTPILTPEGGPTQQNPEATMTMEDVQRLFENADLLEYDVECGEGPYGPTAKAANQQYFLDLAKTPVGQYLPPQLFIHFLDIPEKDKILAAVNQAMQSMQAAAQQKQQAEVEKTMIAAQRKGGAG